jgi:hypothetical protein
MPPLPVEHHFSAAFLHAGGSHRQQCVSLLVLLQVALGVLLPVIASALWVAPVNNDEPQPGSEGGRLQRRGRLAKPLRLLQRAASAALSACGRMNALLADLCRGRGYDPLQCATCLYLLLVNAWLLAKAYAFAQ